MLYGIAVFPDKSVQDAANSWRIRHDPHYCLIAPHMTVREPEEWDEPKLAAAVKQLERAAASIQPFEARFNRVSTFFPVNPVLYFALEDPQPMVRLHEAVCSGPLTMTSETYVYTPHLTIGQKMSEGELHDLYGNLRMKSFELSSRIDRFHLLYRTESGVWTAYQSFQLG
jgi:2''-5'' RNA ligase